MPNYVILNGTQFRPTSIDVELEKKGTVQEAANGYTRFYHQAHKRKWTLHWNNLKETFVPAIRTIYLLTTTFTFTDEDSTAYTVLCLPGGFKTTLDAGTISLNGTKYYSVDLIIQEA